MQFTEAHKDNKNTCITWNTPWENYKLIFFLTHTHSHMQHQIPQGKKKKQKREAAKKRY